MTAMYSDSNARARTLVWWQPADLDALHECLNVKLANFGRAWGLEVSLGALSNACDAESSILRQPLSVWSSLETSVDRCRGIWVAATESPVLMLRRALFGAEDVLGRAAGEGAGQSMSAEVAAKAWRALCEVLAGEQAEGAADVLPLGPATDFPSKQRLPWSGAVTGLLTLRGVATVMLPIHLEPGRAHEWIPARAGARATKQPARALTPVFDALSRQSLRVAARLAEIDLDLKALMTLRVGDVVTLPQGLHEPTQLFVLHADQGNACFATGYLGAVDNAKGIQLQAGREKAAASSKT